MAFDELDAAADDFDTLVAASPELDGFCSSAAWILPARAAFAPTAKPLIFRGEAGIAALMSLPLAGGARAGLPLEASWLLASPFASPRPEALVAELVAALRAPPRRVDALLISGIVAGGGAQRALGRLARRPLQHFAPPTERIVASLDGGLDGFLGRRSAKWRAAMRRARRLGAAAGLAFERHSACSDALLARIFALEARSWKALEGAGMNDGPMERFYRLMLPRLARRDALRVIFVTRDGKDVAFCFGGLFTAGGRATYRGLQSSYDDALARLSPGALAHLEMVELCAAEGVTAYDLGTDMDYKRRWGEPSLTTIAVAAIV
jgi:CelD/BcsL family acetyltransferase involved in cellulose biosynthesis